MSCPIFQVDAFAEKPFAGNPAGVCILVEAPDERWMQAVAAEMNLSETGFVTPRNGDFALRWFTPTVEVDLCGHATLASAHILWEQGFVPRRRTVNFHTLSGRLPADAVDNGIRLDFPAEPVKPVAPPHDLLAGIGAKAKFVGRSERQFLVELESEEAVRALRPKFELLATAGTRGVIVTAESATSEFDFVSRYFAPAAGIDEDPVTGSAHCVLGPYWQERLGKARFRAFQASARGGVVGVHVLGDRVHLIGQAVTIFKGELLV